MDRNRTRVDENSHRSAQPGALRSKAFQSSSNTTNIGNAARRVVLGTVTNTQTLNSHANAGSKAPSKTTSSRTTQKISIYGAGSSSNDQHAESSGNSTVASRRTTETVGVFKFKNTGPYSQTSSPEEIVNQGDKQEFPDSDDTEIEVEEDDDLIGTNTLTRDIVSETLAAALRVVPQTSASNPGSLYPVWDRESVSTIIRLDEEFTNKEGLLDDDDEDTYDVSMVAEYGDEIFTYMRGLEVRFQPDPSYMDIQTEINWSMRGILIDWLVQVHHRFNLLPETLFLTVNYIDRFLSIKPVSLSKFQLVGAVALFLAAKYEEINCPSVQEIAYMVDHGFSVDEILKAERYMIDLLEFNLGWPGPMSFLRRTSKADDYDLETRTLAKYLLEISIMDRRFVASPPSWLAAAAHCLSRKMLNKGDWTPAHAYFSGYTRDQLSPVVNLMVDLCRDPIENHKAIFEKYADRKFKKASVFVAEWIQENI